MDLTKIYQKLLKHFGKQYWWPAETRFEVIIGAILTQQTTWKNVELAIKNLKEKGLLDQYSLARVQLNHVEALIRHTGFYRQKARRIINFSKSLVTKCNGSLDKFFGGPQDKLGRTYCQTKPQCPSCPMKNECIYCMQASETGICSP